MTPWRVDFESRTVFYERSCLKNWIAPLFVASLALGQTTPVRVETRDEAMARLKSLKTDPVAGQQKLAELQARCGLRLPGSITKEPLVEMDPPGRLTKSTPR